jgi:hypothetical protein
VEWARRREQTALAWVILGGGGWEQGVRELGRELGSFVRGGAGLGTGTGVRQLWGLVPTTGRFRRSQPLSNVCMVLLEAVLVPTETHVRYRSILDSLRPRFRPWLCPAAC